MLSCLTLAAVAATMAGTLVTFWPWGPNCDYCFAIIIISWEAEVSAMLEPCKK